MRRRMPWRTAVLALLVLAPQAGTAAELDCLIEPWRTVTLSAAIEGVVEAVSVDRGDRVKKGQVIAKLESSVERATVAAARSRAEAQGALRSAQARLKYAERELGRQTNLQQRQITSESEMDEAASNQRVAAAQLLDATEIVAIAQHELRRTEASLRRRTIRSPVAGVVVERILSPGEYADPPQIVRIAQIDPLRVEVFAPLALVGKIEIGMEAQVIPEAPIGGVHKARVSVVDRVIDAASGTFGVRLELPNADYALPAGLNCRVRFPVKD